MRKKTNSSRGKASRDKGKRREREWVHYAAMHGFPGGRRTAQRIGSPESFDVIVPTLPITRWEVKGREKLNMAEFIKQTQEDAEGSDDWGIAWKKNHGEWMCIVPASRLLELMRYAKVIHNE